MRTASEHDVSTALFVNVLMSFATYMVTATIIPMLGPLFLDANISGVDMAKRDKRTIPEAAGVICGVIFLITMFLFIPIAYHENLLSDDSFPHHEFVEFIVGLLSICCMLFLGFADDVLNLKWRHKLYLPTIATLPLLMVYFVNSNSTTVVIPTPFRLWLGEHVNLGLLYYVYMGMLAVFCTNAINIWAGVNGLEVGQSVIIAGSLLIFNFLELGGDFHSYHAFSLYLTMPFFAVSLALLKFNWYPARCFVGDTYCYFAGMTFAVVGILSHFSKTLLLFFMPQIFNFMFSVPQLFHIVPCPRHRLPKYDDESDTVGMSYVRIEWPQLNVVGRAILLVCRFLRLVDFRVVKFANQSDKKDDDRALTRRMGLVECSNMTLICLVLKLCGPMHERTLTCFLLSLQLCGTMAAFFIRYPLAQTFYH